MSDKETMFPGSVVFDSLRARKGKGKVHIRSFVPGREVTLCGRSGQTMQAAEQHQVDGLGYCERCTRVYFEVLSQPWS